MLFISKIRNLFNRSLFNKLIITYFICIFVPVLVIGYFSYFRLEENTRSTYLNDNLQILKAIEKNLQMYFEDFERLTYNAVSSDALLSILRNNPGDEFTYFMQLRDFEGISWNIFGDRNDMEGVYIIGNTNSYYSLSTGNVDVQSAVKQAWYERLMKSSGTFHIFGSHAQSYKSASGLDYVLTVGRKMRDFHNGAPMGVIFVDLKPVVFDRVFQNVDKNEGNILILDKSGQIIYDYDKRNITKNCSSIYPWIDVNRGKDSVETYTRDKNLIISFHSDYLDWIFVKTVPLKKMLGKTRQVTLPVVVVSVICFAGLIILSFWLSNIIVRPLKKLESTMRAVEKGDLNQDVVLKCGGEIQSLATRFNKMLGEIRNLITKVYETKLREADAQNKALQAQINPHFLYNTLESISSFADIKGYEEIPSFIRGLANMFRYSISKDGKPVLLQNEVNHVKNYITLMSLRYRDMFTVDYEIPDELYNSVVIRLMLQPIIENSLFHGIRKAKIKRNIRIKARIISGVLIVKVIDNGLGMENIRLRELRKQLGEETEKLLEMDSKNSSIGLINVHSRIRLLFGEKFGLEIYSIRNIGTVVKVKLPFSKGGETNDTYSAGG